MNASSTQSRQPIDAVPILELKGITKRFPGVVALNNR